MLSAFDRAALQFGLERLEMRRLLTTASLNGTILVIEGTGGNEEITINKLTNGKVSITGVTTQYTPGTQFTQISINAGNGNDLVQIRNNFSYTSATVIGAGGRDTIRGGTGRDSIEGDNDNDTVDGGGGGADFLRGGSGFDTADYTARTDKLKITLDGSANDGATGEGDNVQTEEVLTGSANDTLIGSGSDDFLSGGGGNDQIDGRAANDNVIGASGSDTLLGNTGADYISAKNSDVDQVSGGPQEAGTTDQASLDAVDVPASVVSLPNLVGQQLVAQPPVAQLVGQPTDLDPDYGDGGTQTGPLENSSEVHSAIDSQGRVVFATSVFTDDGEKMRITRYDENGNPDTTFGIAGQVVLDFTPGAEGGFSYDSAENVAIGPDDSILVVGTTSFPEQDADVAVAWLTSAGTAQPDFGDDGMVVVDFSSEFVTTDEQGRDVVVDEQDRVVVAAAHFVNDSGFVDYFAALRLTSEGELDPSFNDGAGFNRIDVGFGDSVNAIALQTLDGDDGEQRIVLGGTANGQYTLARFDSAGKIDEEFGPETGFVRHGTDPFGTINDIAVEEDNTIVAVGYADLNEGALVGSITAIGNNKATQLIFEEDGAFVSEFVGAQSNQARYHGVSIDELGRILSVGILDGDYLVTRTDSEGLDLPVIVTNFDSEFNTRDMGTSSRTMDDGKLVVGGQNSLSSEGPNTPSAARYLGDSATPPGQIPDIEEVIDVDNPPPEFEERIANLSPSALLAIFSQPDTNGDATIDPPEDRDDLVVLHTGVNENGEKELTVTWNGVVIGWYDPATLHLLTINTGAGNDTVVSDDTVTNDIDIDLGTGNDQFKGGKERGVVLGGPGNDDLRGGRHADALVGGPGIDFIKSDRGRDIAIGGTGIDLITGGLGEDILIGGTTIYDTDFVALRSLLDTWRQPLPRSVRVTQLKTGGGPNGTNVLTTGPGGTVSSGIIDLLLGGAGQDWIIR